MGLVSDFVLSKFGFENCSVKPIGNGHINDTFLIVEKDVIIQRINTTVFPSPEKLMENLVGVTTFLKEKISRRGGNTERETLTFIPTKEGKYYFRDSDGSCWRAMVFIDNTWSYEKAETEESFEEAGLCFGNFSKDLSDYPVKDLHEIIPSFHNTKNRLKQFMDSVKNNAVSRAESVKKEIDFLLERFNYADLLFDMNLPIKVTHNDTKLNNVLIDKKTNRGICVVDLDTVMPGFVANDFGDAIRTGASTAEEDEKDTSKVCFNINMYKAFLKGFIKGAGSSLSESELNSLVYGALVMTYEQALRFLADYLNGDVYYKVSYPEHNLVRTRTQIALLTDMEKQISEMKKLVASEGHLNADSQKNT